MRVAQTLGEMEMSMPVREMPGRDVMGKLRVAAALQEISLLLRLTSAEPVRVRAYSRAARAVASFEGDLSRLVREKRLTEIWGVGDALAAVIQQIFRTGSSPLLEKRRSQVPRTAIVLSRIPGLSPARIRKLAENFDFGSVDDFKEAIRKGQIRSTKGFGPKTEAALLELIRLHETRERRTLLLHALGTADRVIDYLRLWPELIHVDKAGAIRRWKETIGTIRITAAVSGSVKQFIDYFLEFPLVAEIDSHTRDSARVTLIEGITVALFVARPAGYPILLHNQTGSKAHVTRVSEIAQRLGIEITERAMNIRSERRTVPVASEADVYRQLGMQYVPPELREGIGETEAALSHSISEDLIQESDLKGMVHCHSTYSDGKNSIEEMARAAEEIGMSYLTITDHSPTAHYAGGVSIDELKRQWDEIARVQELVSIRILRGTESDILREGSLDYPDAILEQFEVIIASIHNRYRLDSDQMTKRVINAMKNPLFKIWGHPLGRLVQSRPPIECRVEEILDVIADGPAAIEISADPHRLDLEPRWTREARRRNISFVISSDAHSISDLHNLRFGIGIARRAGVIRSEVLNTLDERTFRSKVSPLGARRP